MAENTEEVEELLFFDTFSHGVNEDLNLDLVQFPKPVYITEVRIIPLGARVQADVPGRWRMGATNPSQFHIEFFVNDLSRPGATFECLGDFDYNQNDCINLECAQNDETVRQILTDGLVLRGWYTAITLAVYGKLAKAKPIISQPVEITQPQQPVAAVAPQQQQQQPQPPLPPQQVVNPPAQISTPTTVVEVAEPYEDPLVYPTPTAVVPPPIIQATASASFYSSTSSPKEPPPPPASRSYRDRDRERNSRGGDPSSGGGGSSSMYRDESSDSDWDRDERQEEVMRRTSRDDLMSGSNVIAAPAALPPTIRPPSREVSRTRESNSRAYSRSSSREREYHSRNKREQWSRSPEYRHSSSRRTRTVSYSKRDKSRDRDRDRERDRDRDRERDRGDRRTPPPSLSSKRGNSHERRPRSPPLPPVHSSHGGRPRTPERPSASPANSLDLMKSAKDHHESKRNYDKGGQSIRDHQTSSLDERGKSIQSPPSPPPTRPPSVPLIAVPLSPKISVDQPSVKSPTPPVVSNIDSVAAPVATDIRTPNITAEDSATSPQPEPFEPILSDDEIGDEPEPTPIDVIDDEISDIEDVIKPFNVTTATLERFPGRDPLDEKKFELAHQLLQKIKSRDVTLKSVSDFLNLPADSKENWVHSVEHFVQVLNIIHSFSFSKRNQILSTLLLENTDVLVLLIKIGLDFDCAMDQPQPGYKIRHIKIGTRLAELLGTCTDLIGILLYREKYDIFRQLFNIYEQKYMALSIKLMICKAIYSCLDSKVAMDYFLNVSNISPGDSVSVYQQLVCALQENPLTRAKYAIRSLIKKVNLYESLQLIREIVTKFFVMQNFENRSTDLQLLKVTMDEVLAAYTHDEISYTQPKRFLPVAAKFEICPDSSAQRSTSFSFISYFGIHAFLETLLLMVSNQWNLPPTIMSVTLDLLESLVRHPIGLEYLYENIETTDVLVKCLIQKNGESDDAMMDTTNENDETIPSVLVDDKRTEEITKSRNYKLGVEISYKIKSKFFLDAISNTLCTDAGDLNDYLHGFYSLAVTNPIGRNHVTQIIAMENNIQIILNVIDRERKYEQSLPPLIFPQSSVKSPGSTIDGNKISSVANTTPTPSTGVVTKLQSPVIGYAIDLLDMTVRNCLNLDYLQIHGTALQHLIKSALPFDTSISNGIIEMSIYLKPLDIPNVFDYENITPLYEIVKQSIDYISTFPADVITALRILNYLTVHPKYWSSDFDSSSSIDEDDDDNNSATTAIIGDTDNGGDQTTIDRLRSSAGINIGNGQHRELKYKFVVLQLYSADGITTMLSILDKLTSHFEQPGLHKSLLATQQGVLTTHILWPTIKILQKMLVYVVQSRNTQYKDLTAIEPLLKCYALLHHVPGSAAASSAATQIQEEIIRILLAFTQPTPLEGVDTESIHKSLWTQMICECGKFILSGPSAYLPGLLALSELLPIPLPIYTAVPLLGGESNRLITERQLWSAHLHPQSVQLSEIIQSICTACNAEILIALARVCSQLADLAPNMAVLVAKSLVDLILTESQPITGCRLLNFLTRLTKMPAMKSAVLSIMSGKFCDYLLNILTSTNSTTNTTTITTPPPSTLTSSSLLLKSHTKSTILQQRSAYRLLMVLFDYNIGFTSTRGIKNENLIICNALPAKDILPSFVSAVVENFFNNALIEPTIIGTDKNLRCIFDGLRAINLFCKLDYTFYLLRSVLEKYKTKIQQLLVKFSTLTTNQSISKLVGKFLDFLLNLIELKDYTVYRSQTLSATDLSVILSYPLNVAAKSSSTINDTAADEPTATKVATQIGCTTSSTKKHPLNELNDLYQQSPPSTKNSLISNKIDKILKKLEELDPSTILVDNLQEISEPSFGQPSGIVQQFNIRPIFIPIDGDYNETIHSNYWGNYVANNDADHDDDDDGDEDDSTDDEETVERIACDLLELIKTCLPVDVNIMSECKRLLHLSASPQSNRERTTIAPCFRTRRVEVEPTTGRPEKKIYVTRGRGFPRTPTSRGDLFRSRPPNTSRPPSLHVDDFLALETCGAQPTGPTGYNKLSREIISIRGTRGGRGRGGGGFNTGDRGGGGGRLNSGGGTSNVYRQTNRRTNSPSTWQSGGVGGGGGGGGMGNVGGHQMDQQSGGGQQHYRTATSEPVGSHFQGGSGSGGGNINDYGSVGGGGGGGGSGGVGGGGHFSNQQQRGGRMRGSSRPPRNFTRQ